MKTTSHAQTLLTNNGNNDNSEKSTELHSKIANFLAIKLLENVICDKIKIFDTKEIFNLSEVEIVEFYKDECFTEHKEEEIAKVL